MRLFRVVTGVLALVGAFLLAALVWLTALLWWASADILKKVKNT